jgi:hypothetical protein
MNKENDIIWRENLARQRVLQLDKNSKKKLSDEQKFNVLEVCFFFIDFFVGLCLFG